MYVVFTMVCCHFQRSTYCVQYTLHLSMGVTFIYTNFLINIGLLRYFQLGVTVCGLWYRLVFQTAGSAVVIETIMCF